jgi:hypothetical protein
MLEELTWEFRYALLACSDDGSDDIILEDTYHLQLDEINAWYEGNEIACYELR